MTINMLPDDALLEIFQLCISPYCHYDRGWWQRLVHVCQRWRSVVFGSPRFLNLQLHYRDTSPARKMLDLWPALPMTITSRMVRDWQRPSLREEQMDNTLAALEHHDRICEIDLCVHSDSDLDQVGQVMQKPFPLLTDLRIRSESYTASPPGLPDAFLDGSASHLSRLTLDYIPFPALPNLLLSATDLCTLELLAIPLSGYMISPQTMVACLSAMTRLDGLALEFHLPPLTDQESVPPPPPTRAVLPALTFWRFSGICGYLEDLVAGIDVPLLRLFSMSFFDEFTFYTPQLFNFISCTDHLRSPCRADVIFYREAVLVKLYPDTDPFSKPLVELQVLYGQLSSLALLCSSCLSSLSTLDRLEIVQGKFGDSEPPDDMENTQWLEILRPFVVVKNLHLVGRLALRVMSALGELAGDRATEVLPVLQNIFIERLLPTGPLQEAVGRFIAVRQLSGHTVAAHPWERYADFLLKLERSLKSKGA
jgi:hypothetical protein